MATPTKDAPPNSTSASDKPSSIKYEYMFEKNKSPTQQLDAILRAIARHIVSQVGDKTETELKPKKLAAFYKAVGGDYDALFIQNDNTTISWMWTVTGCQHSLQPSDNDFEAPSVPALTIRGFSRWEALEILLGPEEHVPFMQYAVKNWSLRHPDTGEVFPPELPREMFPLEPDPEVDRWHTSCADRLWKDARTKEEPKEEEPHPTKARSVPDDNKYAYAQPNTNQFQPSGRPPPRPDARPLHRSRPFSYVHVPGRAPGPSGARMGPRSPERDYRATPPDDLGRRRSFSDYPSPTQERSPPPPSYPRTFLDPNLKRPPQGRRHSHPRHYSSDDSSAEEPDIPPLRRRPQSPPPSKRRFAPPTAPQPPPAVNNGSVRSHRSDPRETDLKRRSGNSPFGSIRDKLTGLMNGGRNPERPRTESRQNSYIDSPRGRRSPQRTHSSRVTPIPAYAEPESDDTSEPETSGDGRRRRRIRDDRQRNYYRDRGRPYELDRELDDDVDPATQRNRQHLRRPEPHRRTSSHADVDRRRGDAVFDSRGREWIRDERRRPERRSPDDRGSPSPMAGVPGRRYPDGVYT